jgi:hydroxyacyl-ACP dehydratase HTD2-like protein with hotdog domain
MGKDNLCWEHISETTHIPELIVCPDHAQIFMFSAITWNRHHIHYSKDAAVNERLTDIVVQRGLIGNFFARLITNWIGGAAELCYLTWKVTKSALPDKNIICRGKIKELINLGNEKYLICNVTASNENDELIASGNAKVVFTSNHIPN